MLTAFAWLSAAHIAAIGAIAPEPMLLASVPATDGDAVPIRPGEILQLQEVRPLPGELDTTPVFNSNSPELVQEEGILLSTFPPTDMVQPEAHLDFAFEGRFDLFAHHVARGLAYDDRRTLFLGAVVYNPSSDPVRLNVLHGVSYLSQEAPFNTLPTLVSNPIGRVFAGPGSRTVTDMLQGRRQDQWPREVTIPPRQAYLLMNAPIPLRRLPFAADATLPPGSVLPGATTGRSPTTLAAIPTQPNQPPRQLPSNGRSALLYLYSTDPVYAATLAMYAPETNTGQERAPTLQEWLALLVNGGLAGPRDIPPTNPDEFRKEDQDERFFYGRVAGVAQGSEWTATATDAGASYLTIPTVGESFSYVISTVDHNTFGTSQIQSAPMLARYPDTAYRAHGNYGVRYKVALPLYNPTEATQRVLIRLQTPLQDESLKTGLRFLSNPEDRIFFRGTLRIRYATRRGLMRSRYVHIVQRQGQRGDPLLNLSIPPGEEIPVEVEFLYPPDATPPQVLTVSTVVIPDATSPAPEPETAPETEEEVEPALETIETEATPVDDDLDTDSEAVPTAAPIEDN